MWIYNHIGRSTIFVDTFQWLSQFMTLLGWLRQSINICFFSLTNALPYWRSRSSGSAGFMNSLLSQGGAPWVKEDLTSPAEGFCPNTEQWLHVSFISRYSHFYCIYSLNVFVPELKNHSFHCTRERKDWRY